MHFMCMGVIKEEEQLSIIHTVACLTGQAAEGQVWL